MNTNMREAFLNANVNNSAIGSALVASVINAVSSKAGVLRPGRGWTANVSKRTEKKLREEGVFA